MKIGILKKKEESAVTHYRIAPYLDLARTDGHFVFQYPPESLTDDLCRGLDVLIVHRPASESEIKAVYRAKWAGVAIWLDLDDMLWAIPPANAAYLNYSPQVHTCITDAKPNIDSMGAHYRHYSLRTYPQYRQKMLNYMAAFAQLPFSHPHKEANQRYQIEGERYLRYLWEKETGCKPE